MHECGHYMSDTGHFVLNKFNSYPFQFIIVYLPALTMGMSIVYYYSKLFG